MQQSVVERCLSEQEFESVKVSSGMIHFSSTPALHLSQPGLCEFDTMLELISLVCQKTTLAEASLNYFQLENNMRLTINFNEKGII